MITGIILALYKVSKSNEFVQCTKPRFFNTILRPLPLPHPYPKRHRMGRKQIVQKRTKKKHIIIFVFFCCCSPKSDKKTYLHERAILQNSFREIVMPSTQGSVCKVTSRAMRQTVTSDNKPFHLHEHFYITPHLDVLINSARVDSGSAEIAS